MTAIADLVTRLIASGTPPEVAAVVISEAFAAGVLSANPQTSADESVTRRRENDRIRQQKRRDNLRTSADLRDNPQMSQTALYKKERIEGRKEEREPRKARASQLPGDWQPEDTAWQAATERIGQPRAVAELQKFKNHAADKGRVSKSWNAAWRNWIDRSLDYGGGTGPKGTTNGRRTVHDAARDLSARVKALDEPAPELCDGSGGNPLRLLPAR